MIPISKPYMTELEAKAAYEVILSGWITQGPKVKEFEDIFSDYVGTRFACAVSSCTTALHLALKVAGVLPGDVVLTLSHSFIATANCVRLCGAEPVFIDIEPNSYNISVLSLEQCLVNDCVMKDGQLFYKDVAKLCSVDSPLTLLQKDKIGRVAAIMPVHQMGMPCEIEKIITIAKKYNLPVVEDAACAIGSEININGQWEKIGKPHGDLACFSFHPRKIVSTGDGGMITTNNEEFDKRIRLLRQHGMSVSDTVRHNAKKMIIEQYLETAYNYRMTDIQAAIGIEQMKRLPEIIEERQKINELYRKYLSALTYIELPIKPDSVNTNWQSYPVRILKGTSNTRNELIQFLFDNEISSKPGIMNAHIEKPYIDSDYSLTNSEIARDTVILLPFFNGLSENNIRKICDLIIKFFQR